MLFKQLTDAEAFIGTISLAIFRTHASQNCAPKKRFVIQQFQEVISGWVLTEPERGWGHLVCLQPLTSLRSDQREADSDLTVRIGCSVDGANRAQPDLAAPDLVISKTCV